MKLFSKIYYQNTFVELLQKHKFFVLIKSSFVICLILFNYLDDFTKTIIMKMLGPDLSGHWKAAIIILFVGCSIISVIFISLLKNKLLRFTLISIFAFSIALNYLAYSLTNENLYIDTIISLLQVSARLFSMYNHLLSTYYKDIAIAIIAFIVITSALYYLPKKVNPKLPIYYSFFFIALSISLFIIPVRFGLLKDFRWLPISIALPYRISTASYIVKRLESFKREPVHYRGQPVPDVSKVILIIDESIASSSISLNGAPPAVTPYLAGSPECISFGTALSATNFSVGSNLLLRSGLQPRDLPDAEMYSLRRASIWQYAKKAGYRTVYINSWPWFHSFMTYEERTQIDAIYSTADENLPLSDFNGAALLEDIINSNTPTFVIMNKYGAHFPYYWTYPQGRDIFFPVETAFELSERNRLWDKVLQFFYWKSGFATKSSISDKLKNIKKVTEEGDPPPLQKFNTGHPLINTYYNSVNWSFDNFLRYLLTQSTLDNTVIIHTSDHGISMAGLSNKNGSYFQIKDPCLEEFEVPLLVFTSHPQWRTKFQRAKAINFDKLSHFNIFPTLLALMGYDPNWVRKEVGQSMLYPNEGKRQVFSGFIFDKAMIRAYCESTLN